jgi:hypothetical protein
MKDLFPPTINHSLALIAVLTKISQNHFNNLPPAVILWPQISRRPPVPGAPSIAAVSSPRRALLPRGRDNAGGRGALVLRPNRHTKPSRSEHSADTLVPDELETRNSKHTPRPLCAPYACADIWTTSIGDAHAGCCFFRKLLYEGGKTKEFVLTEYYHG